MWVLGHDDHDLEDRGEEFYCKTCDQHIPKKPGSKVSVGPDIDLHDDDISVGVVIKIGD